MKQLLLASLFSISPFFLLGQSIIEKYIGQPLHSDDRAIYFTNTEDGGIIVTGTTTEVAANLHDAFLWKLDANGLTQWFKTYGDTKEDEGTYVIESPDGGFLMGGFTGKNGTSDGVMIKVDNAGNKLWERTVDKALNETIQKITWVPNMGFLVVCNTTYNYFTWGYCYRFFLSETGTMLTDPLFVSAHHTQTAACPEGGFYLTKNNATSTIVEKYGLDGNLQWSKSLSRNFWQSSELIVGSNGRVYTGGVSNYGENHFFCLGPDGALLWDRALGNTAAKLHHISVGSNASLQAFLQPPNSYQTFEPLLYRVGFDSLGAVEATDTFLLPSSLPSFVTKMMLSGPNSAFFMGYNEKANNVGEILAAQPTIWRLNTTNAQVTADWIAPFVSEQQFGNEKLLKAQVTADQGYWVLSEEQEPNTGDAFLRLMRTDSLGEILHSIPLPLRPPYLNAPWINDMVALPDNGILIAYTRQDSLFACKYASNGAISWLRLIDVHRSASTANDIVLLSDGGFALYTTKGVVGPQGNRIYRMQADGTPVSVRHFGFDDGYPIKIFAAKESYGCFAKVGNKTVLYTLDQNGNVTWSKAIEFYCQEWSIPHFIHTLDGGLLFQLDCLDEDIGSTKMIKLDAQYEVQWSRDASQINGLANLNLQDLPCKGFSLQTAAGYSGSGPILFDNPTVLHQYDLIGHLTITDTIYYSPETRISGQGGLPGFTIGFWENRYHSISQDLHFVRVAFPDAPRLPASNGLLISPNPSSTITCIGFTDNYIGPISVRIFDSKGDQVQVFMENKTAENWQKIINGYDLRNGVYLVQVKAGETVFVGKWVKL